MTLWLRTTPTIAAALCLFLLSTPVYRAHAQNPSDVNITPRERPGEELSQMPRPDIRVDSQMVLIPVSVNDPLGRPVAGLDAINFQIADNGTAQTISAFFRDEEPVALGLVLDTSGSMGLMLAQARRAATFFVANANPEDEFALVEFSKQANLTVPLTKNLEHLRYELLFNESKGQTALLDAVYLGVHELLKSSLRRKALIVVSDGGDNNSRYTLSEVRTIVQESNVLIYSVSIGSNQANPGLLRAFSEATGGRVFDSGMGLGTLQDVAQKIAIDLRNRYVLGYVPTDRERDGLYHKVDLQLLTPRGLPKLTTYWKKGYFAPTE